MQFFISRAGPDAEWAKWISNVLEDAGYETELQDFDFRPGDSIPRMMHEAIRRADHMIAVISPDYMSREFTQSELFAGYFHDPIGKKRFVIPVVVVPHRDDGLFAQFAYVSFVGQSADRCKDLLLKAARGERVVERVPFPGPRAPVAARLGAPASPALARKPRIGVRTSIQKLPTVDAYVVGRDTELAWLEQAWSSPFTNFAQIIAPGGTGKTALMTKWYRRHLDGATIFGWSFYSQGTREKSQTSSDPFFAEALPWFGITVQPTESIWAKVDRLVERLRQERVLLILDGIEPLQNTDGSLRDLALKALLDELAARNAGMVLCTTRVRLSDISDDEPRAVSLDLENLQPADGAKYLAHLKVQGPEDELRAASAAYGNHALALTLLGTYLVTFCDGDIRRCTEIRQIQVDETRPGRHAHKVMASYARMYEGQPELDILRALGYFDRPAEPEALKLVLPKMEDRKYLAALKRLKEARLILTSDSAQPIDCHPLVREHFAAEATKEGHARLYEHYKKQAPYRPETLEEMTPLCYAVYHGCRAGKHQEALDDVYCDRILRGKEAYLNKRLGANGTDLSLLANLFENPWTQPVAALLLSNQSWVVNQAGFALRAVSRLADAVEPMRVAAEAYVGQGHCQNAAISYGSLSALLLALGSVPEATSEALRAFDLAERSGDDFLRMVSRSELADAFHQSGDTAESLRLFREAEQLHAESQPKYAMLYSVPGHQYCDLLVAQGRTDEVIRRATRTLPWVEQHHLLLDIGLDHLSLGCAYPTGSADAARHRDQAVGFLRRGGRLDYLPRALLARGTPQDLEEVFRIATRSGMRLHLTDYHLASARLALKNSHRDQAREHFEKAANLIRETGYHRRDAELEQLRSLL